MMFNTMKINLNSLRFVEVGYNNSEKKYYADYYLNNKSISTVTANNSDELIGLMVGNGYFLSNDLTLFDLFKIYNNIKHFFEGVK